jgi:hypothetical protein
MDHVLILLFTKKCQLVLFHFGNGLFLFCSLGTSFVHAVPFETVIIEPFSRPTRFKKTKKL